MADYEPVVFLNSLGEEISNDPVWHARKTLEQYDAQANAAQSAATGSPASDEDEDLDTPEDYKGFDGAALKDLATTRGVDITGLKKVGEVRAALIADDTKKAAEAEVAAANAGSQE